MKCYPVASAARRRRSEYSNISKEYNNMFICELPRITIPSYVTYSFYFKVTGDVFLPRLAVDNDDDVMTADGM